MNRNHHITWLLIGLVFLLADVPTIQGQTGHMIPSNHGLGGGGTAYVDSYHANFINPANLMIGTEYRPRTSFGILTGINASAGGSLANIQSYNRYLTNGQTISEPVATAMLDEWFGMDPSENRSMNLEVSNTLAGFAYRSTNWAVSMALRNRAMADLDLNRGVAELFFRGPDPDLFDNGRPINVNFETLLFTEFSVGYSRKLLDIPSIPGLAKDIQLFVGFAPKLLFGQHTSRFNLESELMVYSADESRNARFYHQFHYRMETVGEMSSQLNQYYQDKRVEGMNVQPEDYLDPKATDFYGLRATGIGLDLGATLVMDISSFPLTDLMIFNGDRKLTVGVSITDIGAVPFGNTSAVFSADDVVDWQGFDFDREIIEEEFDGDDGKYFESVLKDSIGNDIYANFFPEDNAKITRGLPVRYNVGIHLKLGRLGFMMDAGAGGNERGINSRRVYLALGSEYRLLDIIPIRLGIRTGGYSSTSYHAGTGLEFRNFEFSVSVSGVANSSNYGSSVGAAWSGFVFHF